MKKTTHNKNTDSETIREVAAGTLDITAGKKLYSEIQKQTAELKDFNDRVEKDLEDLDKELDSNKKTELSESVQIANDSKEMDNIDKEFDTGLINIYADVVDKIGDDM
jgi:gamma-glutamylcysteine synthetase